MVFFTTADNLKHFFWDTVDEFGIPVMGYVFPTSPFLIINYLREREDAIKKR
jgi:hypothetical protein